MTTPERRSEAEILLEAAGYLRRVAARITEIAEDQRLIRKVLRWTGWRHTITTIITAGLIAAFLWQNHTLQRAGDRRDKALEAAQASLAEIRSCTHPGGACYEKARRDRADDRRRLITDICSLFAQGDPDRLASCVNTALHPPKASR